MFTQRVGSVSLFCFEIKQPASPRIAINIVTKRSTTNRNNINVGYLTLLELLLNLVVENGSIVAQSAVLSISQCYLYTYSKLIYHLRELSSLIVDIKLLEVLINSVTPRNFV